MQEKFKVNLGGIITLLSEHLYSTPSVFVRELLQNGADAIQAVQKNKPDFNGKIIFNLNGDENTLTVRDNGIGLDKSDINAFLSVIGKSSKYMQNAAGITVKDNDFIGQFGIGLLSCFIVSDQITVMTRKQDSEETYMWVGKSDGTYEVTQIVTDEEIPYGTSISLTAKPTHLDYFKKDYLIQIIKYYGMLLPCQIVFVTNGQSIRLDEPDCFMSRLSIEETGRHIFEKEFLDVIHIKGDTVHGAIYILDREMAVTAAKKGRIYSKGILITEECTGLMPDWAVFMMPLLSCDNLRLTASREDIVPDEHLRETKEFIEEQIKDYFDFIFKDDPVLFDRLLTTHMRAIRQLACDDDRLFDMFIDHIEFVTTLGDMSLRKISRKGKGILYTSSMDEYNQIKAIARAQGICVVNATYVFSEELIHKFITTQSNVIAAEISPNMFHDALKLAPADSSSENFLRLARDAVSETDCDVDLKCFEPVELPVIYTISDQAKLFSEMKQFAKANDLFADISGAMLANIKSDGAKLCFNYNNKLIKKLMAHQNDQVVCSTAIILYVQAKINGGQTVTRTEYQLMNESILSLLDMCE